MARSEMGKQPLWLDVSSWQGQINYSALSSVDGYDKVFGIFSRAGWGEDGGYIDQYFERNWSKTKQFGMYRSSYWAYWPYYPMIHQLDLWYNANPTIDIIPRMIDLEVGNAPAEFIAEQTLLMSDKILERDGHRPIIYSRVDLIEDWLSDNWSESELNAHYYLLAQYDMSTPSNPSESNGIVVPDKINPKNILFKQTSPHYEMYDGSGPMDRDRWIWTDAETMHEQIEDTWGGGPIGPDPEPDPEPDCCAEIEIIKTKQNSMEMIITDSKSSIDSNSNKINNLRTDLADVKTIVDGNYVSVEQTRSELRSLQDSFEEHVSRLAQLEHVVGEQSSQIGDLESKISEIIRHNKELSDLIEETNVGIDESIEDILSEVERLNSRMDIINDKLSFWNFIREIFR